MKIEIGTNEVEGFVKSYLVKFDGIVILQTPDVLWIGKDAKAQVKHQLFRLMETFEEQGFKVVGKEILKK